jgi:hydrogenase/urease accessory protein HupE
MPFAIVLLTQAAAGAHSFDPALLDLRERDPGIYDVVWKTMVPEGGAVRQLTPVFGAACRRVGDLAPPSTEAEGLVVFRIDCGPHGLHGETIGVSGLQNHPSDVLLRIQWADGTTTTGVLRSGTDEFVVPGTGAGAPIGTVLRRYGALGVEHILTGMDHLAFVLGLLLLVHGWLRLIETISAFTLAHTITLGLAVLGLVHVPSPPVEAMIAISIVLVAVEVLRSPDAPPTLAHRKPWLVAFLFGLMHGLGFAGALAELGLPPDHVPMALLAFNGGVEVGQLAFVAVMILPVMALRRMPRAVQVIPAYGIGAVAVAWTLERVAAFWS